MRCRWCRLCVRISSTHSPYLLSCAAACHPSPAAAPCAPALPRAPSSAFFVLSATSDATWRPLAFHCAMRITAPHGSSLVLLPACPAAPGNIQLEQCVGPHCVGQSRMTTPPSIRHQFYPIGHVEMASLATPKLQLGLRPARPSPARAVPCCAVHGMPHSQASSTL